MVANHMNKKALGHMLYAVSSVSRVKIDSKMCTVTRLGLRYRLGILISLFKEYHYIYIYMYFC